MNLINKIKDIIPDDINKNFKAFYLHFLEYFLNFLV